MSENTEAPAGWGLESSPYHSGETQTQEKAGVRDRAERQGRRMIRHAMPDQHRELFARLPYLFMGSLDAQGRPWASMLAGPPGFVSAPDARTLVIDGRPQPEGPAGAAIAAGAPVGLLGIELETRRRNRANGRIAALDGKRMTVAVEQSFGNCPQYIQARALRGAGGSGAPAALREGALLSPRSAALVAAADTFFIATASTRPGADDPAEGVDVSHRGGRPGFVRVSEEDGHTMLLAPDFRGNSAFNTFGNLAVNPRAGLLFCDFASGALLGLTGAAEVLWDDPAIAGFTGALRLLRFRVEAGVLAERAIRFLWSPPQPAPQLAATGRWDRSATGQAGLPEPPPTVARGPDTRA